MVMCALGLMVFVPLTAVDDARPSRLGWHMYAAAVDLPKVEVTLTDSSSEERSLSNIVSGFRSELDYMEPVARFICAREQNVTSVRLSRSHPNLDAVVECAGS
ncbi:hypothetical protein D7Z96_07210 [Pseudarthrobacter phenanthrenivorans]|uniref:Uncharacterized protein n=1 Tax=Pseudarthrobacter phenanthrenivorans TaxID=361575 RepID=A0A3B0G0Z2_PSEPS|nr:hypothetical protein D7Z96_07210 [Pseudarthrobacter phenanthrenivorans]